MTVKSNAPWPAVALRRVSFRYRGQNREALREVDLVQRPGEMVGIIGASAAGKSTLAKCLNRIVPLFHGGEFEGQVEIAGCAMDGQTVSEAAATVGMVFQDFESQIFSTNVAHEVAFALEQVGMSRDEMRARIGPALAAVGLAGFEARDPTSLSGGEKQRLAIAAVLALRPRVIVMDEPTTDLDPEGRAEVFALIRRLRRQGLALIVIEHELEELRDSDRILLLREGELIADAPAAEVMAKVELLEQCGLRPPGLNRVVAALGIRRHVEGVDEAEQIIRQQIPHLPHPDIASPQAAETSKEEPSASPPLLSLEKLSFSYEAGRPVLDGINLTIAPGEFIALVGRNGSGKTTLVKQMVGLLRPESGRILIDGRERTDLRPSRIATDIGYVFQNPDQQIFAATVRDEVSFGPRNAGLPPDEVRRVADEVLQAVGLDKLADHDPFLLGKGERQRLAVAGVLALRPRLLILDEPTTGLDYREQLRMMALVQRLNRSGVAVLMITHTPWLVAEYARRVIMLEAGHKAFDGPVRTFMANPAVAERASFRPPEVTSLGQRFGVSVLSPGELIDWLRAKN
jgi:energy-coupling factor transporter ATP-binding protein EcfA2